MLWNAWSFKVLIEEFWNAAVSTVVTLVGIVRAFSPVML